MAGAGVVGAGVEAGILHMTPRCEGVVERRNEQAPSSQPRPAHRKQFSFGSATDTRHAGGSRTEATAAFEARAALVANTLLLACSTITGFESVVYSALPVVLPVHILFVELWLVLKFRPELCV